MSFSIGQLQLKRFEDFIVEYEDKVLRPYFLVISSLKVLLKNEEIPCWFDRN